MLLIASLLAGCTTREEGRKDDYTITPLTGPTTGGTQILITANNNFVSMNGLTGVRFGEGGPYSTALLVLDNRNAVAWAPPMNEPKSLPLVLVYSGGSLSVTTGHSFTYTAPGIDSLPAGLPSGIINTLAGNGNPAFGSDNVSAVNTSLFLPGGVVEDSAGNLLIADTYNHRIRAVARTTGTYYGAAMAAGNIYTIAGNGIMGFSGDAGAATAAALNNPSALALDAAGNVLIADAYNHRIRVLAKATGTYYGTSMTAGNIYTVAGNGSGGFSGDASAATTAQLNSPAGVTLDGAGNLVIADTAKHRVRVVAKADGAYYGISMEAGKIYTVAGNGTSGFAGDGALAVNANLADPSSVAVDGFGNLVIADTSNHRVRVVARAAGTLYGVSLTPGNIDTIAGNGSPAFAGDSAPAIQASLHFPCSVVIDAAGNVLISDNYNHRIRAVAAANGKRYNVTLTAGNIHTVAGNGTQGFSGDGSAAISANLTNPLGLGLGSLGTLLLADSGNMRIRGVTP